MTDPYQATEKARGRVAGQVALVTGGASGMGRACCETLAREGAQVVIADIDENGGRKTVRAIGPSAQFCSLDIAQEKDWALAMQTVFESFGNLDILVNCAGIGINGIFEETSLDDWNRVLNTNLTGVFLGCKHGVRAMKKNAHGGSIINISSTAGLLGGGDIAAYSASKGGVTLLTKCVALSCAERALNIRCNSIHPTYADTEMLDPVAAMYPSRDAMKAAMSKNIPLGRLAVAQDIADAVLFLASDESSMITGSAIPVDGGTTAGVPGVHAVD